MAWKHGDDPKMQVCQGCFAWLYRRHRAKKDGKSVKARCSPFVAKSFMARSFQVQWLWSHDLQTLVMDGHEFDEGLSWQEWALTCDVLVIDALARTMCFVICVG